MSESAERVAVMARAIWQEPLEAHFAGRASTATTVAEIARRYCHLVSTWHDARD